MSATHVRPVPAIDDVRELLTRGRGREGRHRAPAASTPRGRRPERLVRRVLTVIGLALIGAVLVLAIALHVAGGRWFVVRTPSMGSAAPVGTLVVTTPTTASALHVGDIVTFHPPTDPGETYTHRVVGTTGGRISTRGDVNGAVDPWLLDDGDLVGRAAAVLPGVGWAVRSLPLLLVGLVAVLLGTARMRHATRRTAARVLGASAVVSLTALVLRPFVGTVVLQTTATTGGTDATVVSTGLLPVRVSASGGRHVDLVAGRVGHLLVPPHHGGPYHLSTALHLAPWGWAVAVVVCALPLLWTLVVGLPGEPDGRGGRDGHGGRDGRRRA